MAKFDLDYDVCKCHSVQLCEILHAINDRGAKTVEDIGVMTDAGTSCRCCVNKHLDNNVVKLPLYLDDILNKLKKG